jgi:hypothetical protein
MSDLKRPQRAASGTGRSGARMTALVLAGLLSSCLVTNNVDYHQPVITSELERIEPTTEFAPTPVEPDEECERLGLGQVRFAVEIRDLNREEDLVLRVMVNKQIVEDYDVPSSGEQLRSLDPPFFCIKQDDLDQPCNLVEALVSSSFPRNRQDPYFARDGDLAVAHWWVIGDAEDNPNASYLDCPDPRPDAGAP